MPLHRVLCNILGRNIFGACILAISLLLLDSYPALLAQSFVFPKDIARFKHISTEQGLVNTRVLSILQDRQGFMWFGTAEGLNRYDGQDFLLYQSELNDPTTLSNNVIWTLYEDRAGYIWVGTSGGLNRYDPNTETFTRYTYNLADGTSLGDDTVNAIYEDANGIFWIGTGQGGLERFDPETEIFIHYQNDPDDPQSLSNNQVTGIREDSFGKLWISTYGGGLNLLVPGKSPEDPPTFRRFQHDPDDPNSLSHDEIEVMTLDSLGFLWLGTWGGGLNRFDISSETFTHYDFDSADPSSVSSDTISAFAIAPNGVLWIGTWDGGLNRFDRASEKFVRYQNDPTDPSSLNHDGIRSLYINSDELLFAGTAGGGINQLDLRPTPYRYFTSQPSNPNSLSQNDVRSVLQDRDGLIWIGTQSGGLNAFDSRTGLVKHYRNDPDDPTTLSNDSIWSLAEDRDGTLWVGTFGGLNKFDRESGGFVRYEHDPDDSQTISSNRIYAIHEDRSGDLWVGTYRGLNRFDKQTGTFTHFLSTPSDPTTLSHDAVQSIAEDASGILWIGTLAGLNRMDPLTETFTRYTHNSLDSSSIGNETIAYIYIDPSGALWLGTYGGLSRFGPNSGKAVNFTMEDGLTSNVVWQIHPDEQGYLWLGTPSGLDRFDPRTNNIRNYNASNGLQVSTFNGRAITKSSSGELLLGSGEGLLIFSPTKIKDETRYAPLVFTGFELSNRPVPIGEDSVLQQAINKSSVLNLSFEDRVISISFAALDYRVAKTLRFRYVLRGFETQWTEVGSNRRFVTYTNLAPGTYEFVVQLLSFDEQWITPGRTLRLVITPPWWETFWFRFMAAGLLLLVASGAYFFRVRMLQQINKGLESQVESRTSSLRLLNSELEQRTNELSTLLTISQDVASTVDLEPPVDIILDYVAQIIDFSTLIVLELAGDELFVIAQRWVAPTALSEEDEFPIRWLKEETELVSKRNPLICADLSREPGVRETMCKTFGEKMAPVIKATRSCMVVPMVARDKFIGLFWFGHTEPGYYSEPQAEYIIAVAHQAAIAVENAHYYQRMEIEAADRERTRIAQDLHDSVSQSLLTANRVAESLPELWDISSEKGKMALSVLQSTLKSSLAEMRTLMLELHPAILGQKPLREILRQLCDGFTSRNQIPVILNMNDDAILPTICQVTFYQIAQATLNNIQHHAGASEVIVELDCLPKWVEMRIADNGVGFDMESVPADRMGLRIMHERAEKIGATFHLQSKPGEGTKISLHYAYPIE